MIQEVAENIYRCSAVDVINAIGNIVQMILLAWLTNRAHNIDKKQIGRKRRSGDRAFPS